MVSVIDDLERRRFVIERDGGQVALFDGAGANIDGRLQLADSTRAVI